MDYREILRLRSLGCSQRQMERDKLVSREKSKEIFEAADRAGISWPIEPDITNQELELLLFPDKYKSVSMYVEPNYAYIHGEARGDHDPIVGGVLPAVPREWTNPVSVYPIWRKVPQMGEDYQGYHAHPAQAW